MQTKPQSLGLPVKVLMGSLPLSISLLTPSPLPQVFPLFTLFPITDV